MTNHLIFWDEHHTNPDVIDYSQAEQEAGAVGGQEHAVVAADGEHEDGAVGPIRTQLTVTAADRLIIDVAKSAADLPLHLRIKVAQPLSLVTKLALATDSPSHRDALMCPEAWVNLQHVEVVETPPHEVFRDHDQYVIVESDYDESQHKHKSLHENIRATWHHLAEFPVNQLRSLYLCPFDIGTLPMCLKTRNVPWPSVEQLHIKHCSVIGDFTRRTVMFLEQHPNLNVLRLELNGVSPDGLVALLDQIRERWASLKELQIVPSDKHGVAAPRPAPVNCAMLVTALKKKPIEVLDLSRLDISPHFYGALLMRHHQRLRKITFGPYVDVVQAFSVCPTAVFTHLTSVTIPDCRWGDVGLQTRTLLQRCGHLQDLTMDEPSCWEYYIFDAVGYFFDRDIVRSEAPLICRFSYTNNGRMDVAWRCIKSFASLQRPPLTVDTVSEGENETDPAIYRFVINQNTRKKIECILTQFPDYFE